MKVALHQYLHIAYFFLQSASLLDSNKCVYVCVCRGSGGEPVVDAEVANFPVCVPDMHTNLHS